MKNLKKLGHPVFLIAIAILIVNDWILKASFHNELTGKLSDFAGLFAFALFLSVLYPKWTKVLHLMTALLFVLWNSVLSQPIIDFCNLNGLPFNRTIDWTDNIALISILASYLFLNKLKNYNVSVSPIIINSIAVISLFAFVASGIQSQEPMEKEIETENERQHPVIKQCADSTIFEQHNN